MKTVSILGSTGSVGCSTIDLLLQAPERFRVAVLVGGRNVARLAEQAIALRAEHAVIADDDALHELRTRLAGTGIGAAAGRQAVCEAAGRPADLTMSAITGAAGLAPTLAAIRDGRAVALANKEALVCAGDVMLRAVRDAGATLLPVDSEHNAIFQAMADRQADQVASITLTASGGPFRTSSLEVMEQASPELALRHPVWSMGAKISIDSATMFNKGLEVIEAARLFALPDARIDVLVHPQSVVHGMVHYADGSVLAQLGAPDMRIPIAHALAWPARMPTNSPRLDLAGIGRLEFEAPDPVRFPALRLAREALRTGGASPAILSAANEIAVEAFLARRIGFLDIARLVEGVMREIGEQTVGDLDAVLHWDQEARRVASLRAAAFTAGSPRRLTGGSPAMLPQLLRTPLAFALVLGVLVFIHELGHYLAARWRGVHVEVFSIGFGPPLLRWHDRVGTEWRLCALPLGGYVKPHGFEGPEEATPEARAAWLPGRTFHDKPVGSRAIVILAGPVFNFLLAIVLFTALFAWVGRPSTVAIATMPPVVGELIPKGAAASAGLRAHDRIEQIDGVAMATIGDVQKRIIASAGQHLSLRIDRNGRTLDVPVVVGSTTPRHGVIGVMFEAPPTRPLPLGGALIAGIDETWTVSVQTLGGIWQMITGKASADQLGGPLRIAQLSGQVAELGVASMIGFIALLSINLGLINLFPIPILDGGRLVFYAVEAVRGRPVSRQVQEYGFRAGFALIACLFLFVTFNDLSHLGLFQWVAGLVD